MNKSKVSSSNKTTSIMTTKVKRYRKPEAEKRREYRAKRKVVFEGYRAGQISLEEMRFKLSFLQGQYSIH